MRKPINKNSSDAEIRRHETRLLDATLDILKGKPGSRRGRGTTFTLYVQDHGEYFAPDQWEGLLQGPRGKEVKRFVCRSREEVVSKARDYVGKIVGATLTIYD